MSTHALTDCFDDIDNEFGIDFDDDNNVNNVNDVINNDDNVNDVINNVIDSDADDVIDNEFGIDFDDDNVNDAIDNEFGINVNVNVNDKVIKDNKDNDNARNNFEVAYASEHYQISYEEVEPLVNTTLVDHLISSEPEKNKTSIAKALLDIIGSKVKEFTPKSHWTDKQTASRKIMYDKKQAVRDDFVAKWQERLGYVGGWVEVSTNFVYEATAKVADNPLLASIQYCAGYELEKGAPDKFGNRSNRKVLVASKGLPLTNNLGQLVLAILIRACRDLTSTEKIDLIVDLDSLKQYPQINKTKDGLGVIVGEFTFDLATASISRKEGRTQKCLKVVMFDRNFVVDGVELVFIWALNAMRISDKGLAQCINLSSNCFKETNNYGAKPSPTDIKFHVQENMLKEANITTANVNHFPYSNISNSKLQVDTLAWVLSRGCLATCDKQNKSWIVLGAGCEALFVGRDEQGHMINLNDMSKPTKIFNRPAANSFSFAEIL